MKPAPPFSPWEALGTIVTVLSYCESDDPKDGSVRLPWGDAETIRNQVYALRAYISGSQEATRNPKQPKGDKCAAAQEDLCLTCAAKVVERVLNNFVIDEDMHLRHFVKRYQS